MRPDWATPHVHYCGDPACKLDHGYCPKWGLCGERNIPLDHLRQPEPRPPWYGYIVWALALPLVVVAVIGLALYSGLVAVLEWDLPLEDPIDEYGPEHRTPDGAPER